eukprot:3964978-Amphidinium_carterae.1
MFCIIYHLNFRRLRSARVHSMTTEWLIVDSAGSLLAFSANLDYKHKLQHCDTLLQNRTAEAFRVMVLPRARLEFCKSCSVNQGAHRQALILQENVLDNEEIVNTCHWRSHTFANQLS